MSGTKEGGLKARKTNLKLHGKDFYKNIGYLGGITKTTKPKGFACDIQRAKEAGRKGGKISKRGKAKNKVEVKKNAVKFEY